MFHVVFAAEKYGGIGYKNDLPWRLPSDMTYFAELTTTVKDPTSLSRNAVIMGRKTWESLPVRYRPLPGRLNVILSSNADSLATVSKDIVYASSFDDALRKIQEMREADAASIEQVFVIGGVRVFLEALKHVSCNKIYVTHVLDGGDALYDTFLPLSELKSDWVLERRHADIYEKNCQFHHAVYTRKNHEEQWYLDLIQGILDRQRGKVRLDRTRVGTLSEFGKQLCFDLRYHFPLLTTKRVFWKGVVEELLWMLSGCTNATVLAARGVHIWDKNGTRAFLDQRGLTHLREGDLGPVYGHQWRHFGAPYEGCDTDYTGRGVDQIASIVSLIRDDPTSRRIVLQAWNPMQLDEMALPPCHMSAQFYVSDGMLSCQMYQRSADLGLGVPFNIASYALLTYMLAHVCGLTPGMFIHAIGDAHVYSNHVSALELQLQRPPRPFPLLRFTRRVTSMDDFKAEDFVIHNYHPHPSVKMDMAV